MVIKYITEEPHATVPVSLGRRWVTNTIKNTDDGSVTVQLGWCLACSDAVFTEGSLCVTHCGVSSPYI